MFTCFGEAFPEGFPSNSLDLAGCELVFPIITREAEDKMQLVQIPILQGRKQKFREVGHYNPGHTEQRRQLGEYIWGLCSSSAK